MTGPDRKAALARVNHAYTSACWSLDRYVSQRVRTLQWWAACAILAAISVAKCYDDARWLVLALPAAICSFVAAGHAIEVRIARDSLDLRTAELATARQRLEGGAR